MHDYNKAAGILLRSLRRQRGLTQVEAAHLLSTSSPVLSRKERGQEQIERLDIQLAITAYQLNAQESQALWSAAGYLPEPPLHRPAEQIYCQAKRLLTELPFPAFLVDELAEIQAWNQPLVALWVANAAPTNQRQENHSAFCQWIYQHKAQHEEKAEQGIDEVRNALVQYASPFGPIDYLVLQTIFSFHQAHKLFVYVPFGLENHQRYEQFRAQMEIDQLFLGKQTFTQYRAEAPAQVN